MYLNNPRKLSAKAERECDFGRKKKCKMHIGLFGFRLWLYSGYFIFMHSPTGILMQRKDNLRMDIFITQSKKN